MAGALYGQSQTLRYAETHGTRQTTIEYQLVPGAGTITLTATSPDSQEKVLWQTGAGTVDWSLANAKEGIELHAVRASDAIRVTGTLKGKAVDRVLKLDAAPWYQLFGPLLDQLLPAGAAQREFWVLDPAGLAVHRMQVKRAGTEPITLGGQAMPAEKVHFSPAGALAPFWGADFWYRPGDELYLSSRLPEQGGVTVAAIESLPR